MRVVAYLCLPALCARTGLSISGESRSRRVLYNRCALCAAQRIGHVVRIQDIRSARVQTRAIGV